MSDVNTVLANGLTFSYLEAGPRDGPLVLLFHGFPDTARTWRDVLPRLAARGFRAVAPFLRGYHPTSIPADGDYSLSKLGTDVLELIRALGRERAFVVGHDWGAYSSYAAANLEPARIEKLVTVAIPHPRVIRPRNMTPGRLFKGRHFFLFRLPGASGRLRRDDFAAIQAIYRRWSPTWEIPPGELDAVKACFAAPGALDAAVGYYRALPVLGQPAPLLVQTTTVPTLTFYGVDDGVADGALFEEARSAFSGPHELVAVPRAGHFLHREQPELFAEKLLAFLS
jgi:pimeloyl-ACP methyl ester carboxylesterase